MLDAMRAGLALLVLGCGPARSSDSGSASAESSSTASSVESTNETSFGSSVATSVASSATSGDSSTGEPATCPGNVANEPFCYRRVTLDWDGELGRWWGPPTARVGYFGPNGEEAFLLAGEDAGTPMALAFWDGEGFDVQPWGMVPELDHRDGRIPVRMFDGIHSDLVVGGSSQTFAVAPWGPEGPGEPLVVVPPSEGYVASLFTYQPILDVDGDGLDEFAVYTQDWDHRLVGNVDGVPAFIGEEIEHDGSCGGNVAGIGAGFIDADLFVDVAAVGSCEVRNLLGMFAFAAEWGDGVGGFASLGVEYPAVSPSSWLGVADVDGDGFDDVLTGSENGLDFYQTYVELHRSRGDRSFDPPLKFWTDENPPHAYYPGGSSIVVQPNVLHLGDVDGDGAADLLFIHFMVAVVQIATDVQYLEMFDVWDRDTTEVVSAFDFNHDGRLDFVVRDVAEGEYVLMSSA